MRMKWTLPLLLVAAGCSLETQVQIVPLKYTSADVQRGTDLPSMIRKADIMSAVSLASVVEQKQHRSASELASLGQAEMIAGRFDEARRHLRAAIDLQPFRTTYATIAWDLSQLEYMCNNYDASLEWARIASDHGVIVRTWHMQYLEALANVNVYAFRGPRSERIPMRVSKPDVPRVDVKLNKTRIVSGIIDSGAVVSIIPEGLAASLPVRSLGNFDGSFSGLVAEPIPVRFGILDSVQLGDMTLENVPVAIMSDKKMRFLVNGKNEFHMDLLLGANLLKEFRTDLDFRRNLVTFTHLTNADRHPAPDQNLFYESFRPAVRGFVNRRGWYLFILDTGSEVTFLNEKELADLPIQALAPKIHSAMLQGLGGAQKHGPKVQNVELGLDKWGGVFKDLPMYESPEVDRTTGIVGENFLRNFIVTIVFGRMRLDLSPIGLWEMKETGVLAQPGQGQQQQQQQ